MAEVLIIGGMAGGCKTAARLRRLKPNWNITIIEQKSFISYGTCGMPFYASGDIDDFYDLVKTPWGAVRDVDYFKKVKNIDVLISTRITEIQPEKCKLIGLNLKNNQLIELYYDYLVIAIGAKPIKPNFFFEPSERISYFHSPEDAKIFRQKAQTGAIGSAVIIGGGYIGCELSEALVSLWGIETTIIEMEDWLLSKSFDKTIASLIEKRIEDNGINILFGKRVNSIQNNEDGQVKVIFDDEFINTDFVFICPGVKPNVEILENSGIRIGSCGGIVVNQRVQTNFENIYAVGDCVEVENIVIGRNEVCQLGSIANRQGRVAADNIAGIESVFDGVVGNISLKVFGLIASACGITRKKAYQLGIEVASVCGCWYDRPDYMPESRILFAEMIYDKQAMKLLGLQIVGGGEVSRYLDSFSIYLKNKSGVEDLLNFEHSYTPPHSSPMNPLNYLSAMAFEQERNGILCLNPQELLNQEDFNTTKTRDYQFIDLREENEIEQAPIPFKTKQIPINEIRQRKNEIDLGERLVFICQKGPRSYEFAKYFDSIGAKNVSYLGGGVQLLYRLLDFNK